MRKYDELMEQVELTPEARTRILEHIRTADVSADPSSKVRPLSSYKKYLSAAACIAVLLLGAVTIPQLMEEEQQIEKPRPPVGGVLVVPDIVTAASAEELSNIVGFPVEELKWLPFEPDEVTYTAYTKSIAEIEYSAGDMTATFRSSRGNEDNSGRFDSYIVEEPFEAGTFTGVLRGNVENEFTLAIWSDGEISYSVYCPQGLSTFEWMELIGN